MRSTSRSTMSSKSVGSVRAGAAARRIGRETEVVEQLLHGDRFLEDGRLVAAWVGGSGWLMSTSTSVLIRVSGVRKLVGRVGHETAADAGGTVDAVEHVVHGRRQPADLVCLIGTGTGVASRPLYRATSARIDSTG